ncbi:MAG: hypothetical protein M3072_10995 [Candidatus Dormibacteraeota bacterium]|nr:hypothetical protein [Candidatus Dormibacteraeota bacterium]
MSAQFDAASASAICASLSSALLTRVYAVHLLSTGHFAILRLTLAAYLPFVGFAVLEVLA